MVAPVFHGGIVPPFTKPLMLFHNVDIQPSDACPRNFIIFDQTGNRSRIMFHPEICTKFFQDNQEDTDETRISSSLKEDPDDIDALLSMEDDETEERIMMMRSAQQEQAISMHAVHQMLAPITRHYRGGAGPFSRNLPGFATTTGSVKERGIW